MAEPNALDGIAEELWGWMDSEVQYYANALKGGPNGRAPFAADANEVQKRDYFTRAMFTQNPDGTIDYSKPNAEGRSMVMQTYGPQQYAQIFETVRPKQGKRPVMEAEQEPDLGEPPE